MDVKKDATTVSPPWDRNTFPMALCLRAIADAIEHEDPHAVIHLAPDRPTTNRDVVIRVAHHLHQMADKSAFGIFNLLRMLYVRIPSYTMVLNSIAYRRNLSKSTPNNPEARLPGEPPRGFPPPSLPEGTSIAYQHIENIGRPGDTSKVDIGPGPPVPHDQNCGKPNPNPDHTRPPPGLPRQFSRSRTTLFSEPNQTPESYAAMHTKLRQVGSKVARPSGPVPFSRSSLSSRATQPYCVAGPRSRPLTEKEGPCHPATKIPHPLTTIWVKQLHPEPCAVARKYATGRNYRNTDAIPSHLIPSPKQHSVAEPQQTPKSADPASPSNESNMSHEPKKRAPHLSWDDREFDRPMRHLERFPQYRALSTTTAQWSSAANEYTESAAPAQPKPGVPKKNTAKPFALAQPKPEVPEKNEKSESCSPAQPPTEVPKEKKHVKDIAMDEFEPLDFAGLMRANHDPPAPLDFAEIMRANYVAPGQPESEEPEKMEKAQSKVQHPSTSEEENPIDGGRLQQEAQEQPDSEWELLERPKSPESAVKKTFREPDGQGWFANGASFTPKQYGKSSNGSRAE